MNPIVRYMLYLEYMIQKIIFKDENNLHRVTNSKIDKDLRLKKEEIDFKTTRQIERSLRQIVRKRMQGIEISTKEEYERYVSILR